MTGHLCHGVQVRQVGTDSLRQTAQEVGTQPKRTAQTAQVVGTDRPRLSVGTDSPRPGKFGLTFQVQEYDQGIGGLPLDVVAC